MFLPDPVGCRRLTVPDSTEPVLVEGRVSVPNVDLAQRIAEHLIGRELVTKVQLLGPAASFYAWERRVHRTHEWLLVVATTERDFPRVAEALGRLHPYDVPEIVAVPFVGRGGPLGRMPDAPRPSVARMSTHHDDQDRRDRGTEGQHGTDEQEGGTLSEGGSAAQDPGTSLGGADSVPDTPDVNTEVSDAVDINESVQRGEAPASGDEDVPD